MITPQQEVMSHRKCLQGSLTQRSAIYHFSNSNRQHNTDTTALTNTTVRHSSQVSILFGRNPNKSELIMHLRRQTGFICTPPRKSRKQIILTVNSLCALAEFCAFNFSSVAINCNNNNNNNNNKLNQQKTTAKKIWIDFQASQTLTVLIL